MAKKNWRTTRTLFDQHHGQVHFAIPQGAIAVINRDITVGLTVVSTTVVMDRLYRTVLCSYGDNEPDIDWNSVINSEWWRVEVGSPFVIFAEELQKYFL